MSEVKRAKYLQLYNNAKIVVAMVVTCFVTLLIANYFVRDKQIDGCYRSVADRTAHIKEAHAGYKANTIVGNDPAQPKRTREARLEQAKGQWAVVISLEKRVPKDHRITDQGKTDKQFTCEEAFPPLLSFIK